MTQTHLFLPMVLFWSNQEGKRCAAVHVVLLCGIWQEECTTFKSSVYRVPCLGHE